MAVHDDEIEMARTLVCNQKQASAPGRGAQSAHGSGCRCKGVGTKQLPTGSSKAERDKGTKKLSNGFRRQQARARAGSHELVSSENLWATFGSGIVFRCVIQSEFVRGNVRNHEAFLIVQLAIVVQTSMKPWRMAFWL